MGYLGQSPPSQHVTGSQRRAAEILNTRRGRR